MSVDYCEALRKDIELMGVATDELEYDLSFIEYFDGEMQLEELKSKIGAIRDRYRKIADKLLDLEDEIFETKIKIDLLKDNIKARYR